MKIDLIFNTFGEYHRQNVAVDSFRFLKKVFGDTINLRNIQLVSDEDNFYPDIPVERILEKDSFDLVPNGTKHCPLLSEIFEKGLEGDADYFCFVNSDVILMVDAINFIIKNKPKSWACSRMDIYNIPSFQAILDKNVKPVYYEVGGYDFFVFEKEWARQYKEKFLHPFVLGHPLFDVIWTGNIKIFGDNTLLGNGYPPYLFHISHNATWRDRTIPETKWNIDLVQNNHELKLVYNSMALHFKFNLARRQPPYFIKTAYEKEEENNIERSFFNTLNIRNSVI